MQRTLAVLTRVRGMQYKQPSAKVLLYGSGTGISGVWVDGRIAALVISERQKETVP
jgi:hypothetical protein